jgi:phosphatidate cytidylyltransferase
MRFPIMDSRRFYTAFVALPLFYAIVRYLPAWAFGLLVWVGMMIALAEFYRICEAMTAAGSRALQWHRGKIVGLTMGAGMAASSYGYGVGGTGGILTALLLILLVAQLFVYREIRTALRDTALMLLGLLYIVYLLGHLFSLRGSEGGEFAILFLFLVTWGGDSGAYFIGTLLGCSPLAPRVSPKKTVEGAVGGLAFSMAASALGHVWFYPLPSLAHSLVIGLLLGVFGQAGDLAESLFKRSAGVKDSGDYLPGHGGLLDKVDSLIFTAPVLYYYLLWVRP